MEEPSALAPSKAGAFFILSLESVSAHARLVSCRPGRADGFGDRQSEPRDYEETGGARAIAAPTRVSALMSEFAARRSMSIAFSGAQSRRISPFNRSPWRPAIPFRPFMRFGRFPRPEAS